MKRGKSKAGQPKVDGNSTMGIEALVQMNPLVELMLHPPKKRFRPNKWERAWLLLHGWKPRPVGRPKKDV
jgi:hypothetical protein